MDAFENLAHFRVSELTGMETGKYGKYESASANRPAYTTIGGRNIMKDYNDLLKSHERKKKK